MSDSRLRDRLNLDPNKNQAELLADMAKNDNPEIAKGAKESMERILDVVKKKEEEEGK